jgi:hypothetical protein
MADDLCFSDTTIYVLGLLEGSNVHEFTLDGRRLRSFGELFGTPGIIQEVIGGMGKIACVPEQGMIVLFPAILPEVHAYRIRDTRPLWVDSLPEFRTIRIVVGPSGNQYSMLPPADDQGYDRITFLRPLDGRVLLSQSRRVISDIPRGTQEEVISTWFLDVVRGTSVKETKPLPLLLTSADHWAVAVDEKLFPTVSAVGIRYAVRQRATHPPSGG